MKQIDPSEGIGYTTNKACAATTDQWEVTDTDLDTADQGSSLTGGETTSADLS